jgi:hypothetical protein
MLLGLAQALVLRTTITTERQRTFPPREAARSCGLGGTRGGVFAEYIVVLVVCGVVLSSAVVSLGPPLLASYRDNRHILNAPVP